METTIANNIETSGYTKAIINTLVTKLEVVPRHQWQKLLKSVSNDIEKMCSDTIHQSITERLLWVQKTFDKNFAELKESLKADSEDIIEKEKIELEERLKGHRLSDVLILYFITYSKEDFEHFAKDMKTRSEQKKHFIITSIREAFKEIYKEKWKPAEAREEFITNAMGMKHGGEVGPYLTKYISFLEVVRKDIENELVEKVKLLPSITRKSLLEDQ